MENHKRKFFFFPRKNKRRKSVMLFSVVLEELNPSPYDVCFRYVFYAFIFFFLVEILFYSRLIHSTFGLHNTLHTSKVPRGFPARTGKIVFPTENDTENKSQYFYREHRSMAERLKKKKKENVDNGLGGVGGVIVCHTYHKKRGG